MKKPLSLRALPKIVPSAVVAGWLLGGSALANGAWAVTPSKVSLDQSAPSAQETPSTRTDMMRTFKARCPGRVERLLSVALPSERPNFKDIGDICTCAATAMETLPESATADYTAQATQAALACSKPTITARNEQLARKALGPHLTAQGLDASQVGHFSQCAADTHWQHTLKKSREEQRPSAHAWWATCTEQVGRKGLPPPDNLRD